MMRYCAVFLVSCCPIVAVAWQCPSPGMMQTTVGGNYLEGLVFRRADRPSAEAVKSTKVIVYSSAGKRVYTGVTNNDGEFRTCGLQGGDYRIVIDGFGDYYVKLDPKLGKDGGIGSPGVFTLYLTDYGCVWHSHSGN